MSSAPSSVRYAKHGDELAIYDAIVTGHADNGLWPLSPNKILKLIDAALAPPVNGNKPTIGIIDGDNGIEAMTCFELDQQWYTDEWYVSEIFNWVHPDHRASKHAQALLDFQKKFTDNMSASIGKPMALITGVLTVKRLEAKMHLFQRRYPQIGALFAYNLNLPSDVFNQRHIEAVH